MAITEDEIKKFSSVLFDVSGYDLSNYSEKSLGRRIQKILDDNKLNYTGLLFKIKNDTELAEKILKDITVNTTELFRDPQNWHCLKYKILPALKENDVINVWHSGCSTGQEVYSMMMLLNELDLLDKTNIYASDINVDVIEKAKKGIYKYRFNLNYFDNFDKVLKQNPFNFEDIKDVPYDKYFKIDKNKDIIIMNKELRDKPKWQKIDLVKEKNLFYKKFDIIFCRNVLIYFNAKLQTSIIKFFHKNLVENGNLIIGAHESIIGESEKYFKKKYRYYVKRSIY
jgi:chemotaxis protein methyltransferase CheR